MESFEKIALAYMFPVFFPVVKNLISPEPLPDHPVNYISVLCKFPDSPDPDFLVKSRPIAQLDGIEKGNRQK